MLPIQKIPFLNPDSFPCRRIFPLQSPDVFYTGSLYLDQFPSFDQIDFLHPNEFERFHTYPDGARKRSFLAGRYAAKSALTLLTKDLDWTSIDIAPGVFNQPVVHGAKHQVSIAHCGDWATAVAFPEEAPLGIDIEQVGMRILQLKNLFLTPMEIRLIQQLELPQEQGITMFWALKEALSKALKIGLTVQFELVEVSSIQPTISGWEGIFKHFPTFKGLCFEIPQGNIIGAMVMPQHLSLLFP